LWNSRATKKHCILKDCPARETLFPENFAKVLHKSSEGFLYLRSKFSNIGDAKIKKGIFVGPNEKVYF
jgi:hypothetical protein